MSLKGVKLTPEIHKSLFETQSFSCGNPSVDEFLREEALEMQRLYYVQNTIFLDDSGHFVGYCSVSAHSIEIKPPVGESPDKYKERFTEFPALKIQWIGVNQTNQNQGLGKQIIKYVISQALLLNRESNIGCRFIVLDAQYNFHYPNDKKLNPLEFYKKIGFKFSNTSNRAKSKYKKFLAALASLTSGVPIEKPINNVSMYYDIMYFDNSKF